MPEVDFGDDAEAAEVHLAGRSRARLPRESKLERFLHSLTLKPDHNPLLDEPADDIAAAAAAAAASATTGAPNAVAALDDKSGSSSSAQAAAALLSSSDASVSLDTFRTLLHGAGAGDDHGGASRGAGAARNPEADSFAYVENVLESLACLGKLGYALDAVAHRAAAEIHALVDATVDEVGERNESSNRASGNVMSFGNNAAATTTSARDSLLSLSSLTLARAAGTARLAEGATELSRAVETLKDLFWTLYSKLDAVLQGFRVMYEVSQRIAARRDFRDDSRSVLFQLNDVWKPIQGEVRALLHDYLTDEQHGAGASARNPIVSVNEVLRVGGRPARDGKALFKFADSDKRAAHKELKAVEDDVHRALKAALPGLMSDTVAVPSASSQGGQVIVNALARHEERRTDGATAAAQQQHHHRVLVAPDAFNVSVLFGPTLAFITRAREVMPPAVRGKDSIALAGGDDDAAFGAFLDDFVLRTFLPQLEEKVATVFHQAVGGLDAFQEDANYRKISNVPIVKVRILLVVVVCSS